MRISATIWMRFWCRERKVLTTERICHVNRIKGLLFAQGITDYEPLNRNRRDRLEELVTGDGRSLPPYLKAQISRELDRLELLLAEVKEIESERDKLLHAEEQVTRSPAKLLIDIKGIGQEFAAVLCHEGLFRHFDNRRQVAAYAGLAPTPWQSGQVDREQGVSKLAIHGCGRRWSSSLGFGYPTNRDRVLHFGTQTRYFVQWCAVP